MSISNNTATTQSTNDSHPYFTFATDDAGKQVLVLRKAYRGEGHKDYPFSQRGSEPEAVEFPEILKIPDKIGETPVEALAPGMFYRNNRVREIELPSSVRTIPKYFCCYATNLRTVHNSEQIKTIDSAAFSYTRINNIHLPSLTTLGDGVFLNCAYLEVADIGKVPEIPFKTFRDCSLLCEVIGNNVSSIGKQAFFHTRSLRELPLLTHVTNVGDDAFFYSRIVPPFPVQHWGNIRAFPTGDNETDFWTGVEFTPCCNSIRTKLSQTNSAWKDTAYLSGAPNITYGDYGCPIFSAMHIHSAISGKCYSQPDDFVQELKQNGLSRFLCTTDWPGNFENVAPMFRALGYHAEVRGNGTNLSKDDYQALVDALADGAYIYTQVCTFNNWQEAWEPDNDPNGGHAVVLYGINELGEVRVLDSNILHDDFLKDGAEPDTDFYTYTMPYQNMVGPGSDFVIVYPRKRKSLVQWKGWAAPNVYDSASKPSDYPENQVTTYHVDNGNGTPDGQNGIVTVHRVGDYTYRTFVPYDRAALYLQMQTFDEDNNEYIWLNWTECTHRDFTKLLNNSIREDTRHYQLPTGVNVCVISNDCDELPERKMGYLTTYRLFENPEHAREEWQPNGSEHKYVRYVGEDNQWGDWQIVGPVYRVNVTEANNQNQNTDQEQYQADKTIEEILIAVNRGACVRCDICMNGKRFLLPLATISLDENNPVLEYELNVGGQKVTVTQRNASTTVSVT